MMEPVQRWLPKVTPIPVWIWYHSHKAVGLISPRLGSSLFLWYVLTNKIHWKWYFASSRPRFKRPASLLFFFFFFVLDNSCHEKKPNYIVAGKRHVKGMRVYKVGEREASQLLAIVAILPETPDTWMSHMDPSTLV